MELLANEIFMDIFEYLSLADLIRGFTHLNSRFENLISSFLRYPSEMNFQNMMKDDFNRICRDYLPSMTNRIRSLSLYNPDQLTTLFNHGLTFQQFNRLTSLSVDQLTSLEIIGDWNELVHLTHLKLTNCYLNYNDHDILQWMNIIWALPRLRHCHLGIIFRWRSTFLAPTVISSSIESVNLERISCTSDELIHLFHHTPSLRYLSMYMNTSIMDILFPNAFSSLISLKLKFSSSSITTHSIENLLGRMSRLRRLTVEMLDVFMNGHEWRDLIRNSLGNLKEFQMKMEFFFRDRLNTKRYVDQLFQSFQTPFWLEERQWFIRCHFHSQSRSNYACFYTLPYSFDHFPRIDVMDWLSTDPKDGHWSYDRVHTLQYHHCIPSQSIFRKIRSLCLAIDEDFWKIVPSLWHLNTLEVSLNNPSDTAAAQIQVILDQAPHLHLLKFSSWINPTIPIEGLRHSSIRQMDFGKNDKWWEKSDCQRLIDSPLGKQCEYLRINVLNLMNIVYLIDGMPSLRVLNVRKNGDKYTEKFLPIEDKIVQWLQVHLPMTCTMTRSKENGFSIVIEIR